MQSAISISVLGDEFSFHHLAGIALFGEDQHFVFSDNFDLMLEQLNRGETDYCILAVENSIAGDVPGNFQRIADNHLFIANEVVLHISLCLGALPGIEVENLEIIYTHPMGRKECTGFFDQHPKVVFEPTSSTASGAKMIAERNLKNAGVISSKTAIRHHGLNLLLSGLDDHADNRTRFFALTRKSSIPQTTNKMLKASLLLQFHDNQPPGSNESIFKEGKILMIRKLSENKIYLETEFTEISQFNHFLQTIPENLCETETIGLYAKGEIIKEL